MALHVSSEDPDGSSALSYAEGVDYSGLILAVLIAVGVAWLWQRVSKKMNLPFKRWWWVVIAVFILLCLAYGATHTPHSTVR